MTQEEFMIPECPDFIIPDGRPPPADIKLYGIYCIECGDVTNGSRPAETWDEFLEWMKEKSKTHLCDECQKCC